MGRKRVAVVLGAFAIATGLLAGRAVLMSVADGQDFRTFVSGRATIAQTLGAPVERGEILSSDGRSLATSVDMVRVVAAPYQIPSPDSVARDLASELPNGSKSDDEELKDVRKAVSSSGDSGEPSGYSVVETVEPEVAERIAGLALPGITFEPTSHRVYPDGNIASQALGFYGDYGEAFGGVEARYDERLTSGKDVTLTLDSSVQMHLQKALATSVETYEAKSATGVVMRVDDGAIVAMANAPTYENNEFSEASAETQRNRTITDAYEPGSTIKPVTFAAALEENTVSTEDVFTVPDTMQVADRIIQDSLPHRTKVMGLDEILAESSNVGTVQIAELLGGRNLRQHFADFGYGEATGVDLWGESAGSLPAYRDWSGVSIGNIPIGQGLTASPLRVATSYAAIANGGTGVRPHIVQSSDDGDSRDEAQEPLISPETSDIVRTMLQGAVENGTGHLAGVPGYTVAGKTGTSQKIDPDTGTYGEDYDASFAGFAPASNPEFVTVIVVEEPETSIWGEQVAAPAFSEVMDFTLSYFNVRPDSPGTATSAEAEEAR